MVEGPGCTRNGRKMEAAVGRTVVGPPNVDNGSAPLPDDVVKTLVSQTIDSIFTIGKELYIIFTEYSDGLKTETALRLHFGMNGSLNLRNANNISSDVAPWKQNKQVSLRLYFSDDSSRLTILEAWDTNVSTRVSAEDARNKFCTLSCKDACSALFNAQNVFMSLRQDGQNFSISDALLHQHIFPGVGNIIKVESLHRSLVDPRRRVSDLSDAELRRIVRHARQYSMDWLKTGRAGTKLVYNQTVCGSCKGMTVKMQKIGGGDEGESSGRNVLMSRVTFWCFVCQPAKMHNNTADRTVSNQVTTSNNNENAMQQHAQVAAASCSTAAIQQQQLNETSLIVQCPQHGTKSIKLCRVRNSTKQSNLRIFFTCKCRGCNFFSWADNKFPSCKCGPKAALRVSKTATSGGCWFLCCAKADRKSGNNGCGHFEWAKPEQLAALGQYLTPLL